MRKNIDEIRRLFPHCVTEAKGKDGQIQPAIDFDLLRQELSDCLIECLTERYQLNRPGKRNVLLTFETARNLFIEGFKNADIHIDNRSPAENATTRN